jgi:predicted histidine transporter YuiF (NhaC family)
MSKGLFVVIGMTIAYLASFLGLLLAYFSYKKRKKKRDK